MKGADNVVLTLTSARPTQFQTMMQIKERKEMEDMFKKAQKPWAKHLTKVEKCKAEYHTACKMEKSASNLERNASGDSSLSPDQVNIRFWIVHVCTVNCRYNEITII